MYCTGQIRQSMHLLFFSIGILYEGGVYFILEKYNFPMCSFSMRYSILQNFPLENFGSNVGSVFYIEQVLWEINVLSHGSCML